MSDLLKRILSRILYGLLILAGVSFLTFALAQWIPGDPAEILLRGAQESPSQEQIQSLSKELGLDRPLWARYLSWSAGALRGELGLSWRTGRPVIQELADHLPATLELTCFAFLFIVGLSSLGGFVAALRRDKLTDRLFGLSTVVFLSLPNFWLGTLFIYFLGLKWNWFPLLGRGGFSHLILPVLTLGLPVASLQGRVLRTRVVGLMDREYIRFARAKGLKTRTIVKHHLIRNALPSVLSLWGLTLGSLLGGSFVVETLFAWPGLGRLTVEAVLHRDQPLIQGTLLFLALMYGIINQLVDILQKALDPRLKTESFSPEEGAF
jgi:peptide/nickel transport system permease protein